MNTSKMISEIVDIHTKRYLPIHTHDPRVPKSQRKESYVCIRTLPDIEGEGFVADVIVWTTEGGEFSCGGFYEDCDGVGCGKTVEDAVEDLYNKTKKSIPKTKRLSRTGKYVV